MMQAHDSKYRQMLHPRQILEGLLKTKQTSRDKDKLEFALCVSR